MPKITYREDGGKEHVVEADVGKSLMQVAIDNMVPGILGDCGGCCSCATCHVYVDPAWVERTGAAGEDENFMLEGALDVRPTSRLSCQIQVKPELDGLVLQLPARQI
jgi:2Fe-2S ferredoxin